MNKIFHPLLALITLATNNELAKYVEYLKAENKIPPKTRPTAKSGDTQQLGNGRCRPKRPSSVAK